MATVTDVDRAPFLLPAIYTPTLSDDYISDGPKLREFVRLAWRTVEHPNGIVLDLWQAWLIDRILERYPLDHPNPNLAGRLRYRQIVISIPRQNGKSVIGAILALYGLLMHEAGPMVVGVASSAEQAEIVYKRVLYTIQSNPQLRARFKRLTETRGITTKDGTGEYQIKASKGGALQGIPTSLSIIDELHITRPAVWQSLVNGQRTRKNGLTVGITTAGDDNSELLLNLYKLGNRAAGVDAEPDKRLERFGFFVWQAPTAIIPDDDDELTAVLMSCIPALYEGRIEIEALLADVRTTPDPDVVRYVFNLFTASEASFIPPELWARGSRGEPFPEGGRPVFAIDRTPDWSYVTVTATVKIGDVFHTEVAASLVSPTFDQIINLCLYLYRHSPITYVLDGFQLRDLGLELQRRGLPVIIGTQGQMLNASALLYSKLRTRKLMHSDDELLRRQIPGAVRKNVNEGFRIVRKGSTSIDGVIATALGILGAEIARDMGVQVF